MPWQQALMNHMAAQTKHMQRTADALDHLKEECTDLKARLYRLEVIFGVDVNEPLAHPGPLRNPPAQPEPPEDSDEEFEDAEEEADDDMPDDNP